MTSFWEVTERECVEGKCGKIRETIEVKVFERKATVECPATNFCERGVEGKVGKAGVAPESVVSDGSNFTVLGEGNFGNVRTGGETSGVEGGKEVTVGEVESGKPVAVGESSVANGSQLGKGFEGEFEVTVADANVSGGPVRFRRRRG